MWRFLLILVCALAPTDGWSAIGIGKNLVRALDASRHADRIGSANPTSFSSHPPSCHRFNDFPLTSTPRFQWDDARFAAWGRRLTFS